MIHIHTHVSVYLCRERHNVCSVDAKIISINIPPFRERTNADGSPFVVVLAVAGGGVDVVGRSFVRSE